MLNRVLGVFVVAVVLGGCASTQIPAVTERITEPMVLPDTPLQGQGLLVATISARSVAKNAYQRIAATFPDVQIDSTVYRNAVHDGYLVLPLKPGDYNLVMLAVPGGKTMPGTTMPLHYPFHISANRATNLGAIVLLPQRKDESRFWRVRVENNAEMVAYLRKQYPKMTAALQSPTPDLANEAGFVKPVGVEALRQDIARDAFVWHDDWKTTSYVAGEVGTIARLLRSSQGKVAAFDILDTGTTVAMTSCSGRDKRYVCGSAEPALYFVDDEKVTRRPVPFPMKHVWVHTFPPAGLVLVDESLNVYASPDNGGSWTRYSWFPVTKPVYSFTPIRFANGRNGYYVYSPMPIDPLAPNVIYSAYSPAAYRRIDVPKMENWQRLLETPEGLLVGPQNSDTKSESAKLYFLRNGQTRWQALNLPGSRCTSLQHTDATKQAMQIFCDSKTYVSRDGIGTWTEATGK